MLTAFRSLMQGAWMVVRSPGVIVLVVLVTVAAAVPFALVVGSRVQDSLANRPPVSAGAADIDAEWWMDFRAHASGLEATFTPAILGFAAPLSNLSALLDGAPLPWALVAPLAMTLVLWALLWGGILDRYCVEPSGGLRRFAAAAARYAPRMIAVGAAAALVNLILFLTVHRLLFGPVYSALAAAAGSERDAFVARVALYVLFGGCLIVVSLIADYTRIAIAAHNLSGAAALGDAFGFVRRQWPRVLTLYLMTGTLFAAGFVFYGVVEANGGSRVGGWRAVAIGQGFVIGRLIVRLLFAASEGELYRRLAGTART